MVKKIKNIIVQSSNNGISRIILNEPNTYNALSLSTIESLIKIFKNFNKDKLTKVIVIEGRGKLKNISIDYLKNPTTKKNISLIMAKNNLGNTYLSVEADFIYMLLGQILRKYQENALNQQL